MTFHPTRRQFLSTTVAGLASVSGLIAHAEDRTPLRMIVPASAGSGIDTFIRASASAMATVMGGRSIVIENLPGAGGITGTAQIVRAAPDGNTLGFVSNNHVVNPNIYKKMPFDSLKDISPICVIGATPFLLVVNARFSVANLKDLQQALREKPDLYNYASSGNGTILHMAAAQILDELGVQARHIPYRGMAQMVTDLIAGNCQFGVVAAPVAEPHVKSGVLRAIGTATKRRLRTLPDVATYAEQGYPDIDINGWFAVIGPPKMPPAIRDRIHGEIVATFSMPQTMEAMEKLQNVIAPMSVADSAAYFESEIRRYASLASKANVTLD